MYFLIQMARMFIEISCITVIFTSLVEAGDALDLVSFALALILPLQLMIAVFILIDYRLLVTIKNGFKTMVYNFRNNGLFLQFKINGEEQLFIRGSNGDVINYSRLDSPGYKKHFIAIIAIIVFELYAIVMPFGVQDFLAVGEIN